jgi:hydrogenase-4 component E
MNTLSILLALTCVFLLGSSRLRVSIRLVALQGVLLGVAAILNGIGHHSTANWTVGLGGIVLKGAFLPWLLAYVLRRSGTKLEIEPFVGFGASMLSGVVLLALAAWIAWRADIGNRELSHGLFAVSLYLLLTGMFLIITRRKVITQTLGYLVMENGVYAMGIGIGREFSFLVEMGVMLDVFVGVFIMGIMIFQIDRVFDHADADRFTALSDLLSPDDPAPGDKEADR